MKFRIKSRVSKLYFKVIVYDTAEDLQKAGERFDKKSGKENCGHAGVLGLVHPFERYQIKGKKETRHPEIGIIRLTRDSGSEIASHEIIHASIWQYRLENKGNANFGKGNGLKEEAFAHLYGQLFRNLVTKMYRKGIWK